jgi:hypothetical protein
MSDPHSTPPPSAPPPGWQPPSSPAAPGPDRDPDGGSWLGRGVAWALALTILLIPMGIAYLRKSGGDEAYAVGYALGTGAVVVVGADLLRRLWPRVSDSGAPATPLAVAIVALVAIGGQFLLRGIESEDGAAAIERLASSCQESDPEPFGPLPAGTELVELTGPELANFNQVDARALPEGISLDRFVLRRIVVNGRPLGAAAAYPGIGSRPDALAGFQHGVTADAVPAGGSVRTQMIAGQPATVADAPGVGAAVGANGCWGVAVVASSVDQASTLGESLLAG